MSNEPITRREMVKKVAYATPIVLTLAANCSIASAGSDSYDPKDKDKDKDKDKLPK